MQLQFVPPAAAFLILNASNPVDGTPLGSADNLLADLHRQVPFGVGSDFIDEQFDTTGPRKGVVIKLSASTSTAQISLALKSLMNRQHQTLDVRFVAADDLAKLDIDSHDYSIEYFRQESAVNTQFIFHGDSCAKLVHHAPGTVARSITHRNKARNFEEAIQLLAALLRNESLL